MGIAFAGLGVVIVALGVAVVVLRRRIAIVVVAGPSMQPTLQAGDRVLVRRTAPRRLRSGQIVVVERPGPGGGWATTPPSGWPASGREWLIKRLAAVPGDPRPADLAAADGAVVPAGQFAVLGDNAASSLDSRSFGYIPAERLLGVMLRPVRGR